MVTLTPRHGVPACYRHLHRSATAIYRPSRPPFTHLPDGMHYVHPADFAHCTRAWLLLCDACIGRFVPALFVPMRAVKSYVGEDWQELAEIQGWHILVPAGISVLTMPCHPTPPPRSVVIAHGRKDFL